MSPPDKRPQARPGSHPSIELDAVVGAAKGSGESRDYVRPELQRKGTMRGMGAVHPPDLPKADATLIGVAPAAPGSVAPPPELPLEFAATKRPPLPWGRTMRAQSPAQLLAAARRSDPPPASDPPPTSIRVPVDTTSSSSPPGASLPPASLRPEDARIAALERRALAAEAKLRAKEVADSISPDGTVAALRKAQTRLYIGIAAALAILALPLAAYLTAAADKAKTRSESASAQAAHASSAAENAQQGTGANDKQLVALRNEFRQYRANMREVMRLQGVESAKHGDDPDPNDLDPVTPYCARGKVCSGPQLILQKPP